MLKPSLPPLDEAGVEKSEETEAGVSPLAPPGIDPRPGVEMADPAGDDTWELLDNVLDLLPGVLVASQSTLDFALTAGDLETLGILVSLPSLALAFLGLALEVPGLGEALSLVFLRL